MTLAIAVLSGLLLGSFANVVIHRVPQGLSIVRPGSRCPACSADIGAWDNLPVLSWFLLRGRCRACGAAIRPRYLMVEAASAVLFGAAALAFEHPADVALVAAASWVLLVLAIIDLDCKRVPNVIVLPATAVAMVWCVVMAAARGSWSSALASVACAVAGFVLFLVIALVSRGMGMGDVKLAAFIGTVTGWFSPAVWGLSVFAGFLLGGLVAIVLLVAGRAGRRTAIPYAPMLCAGAVIALYVGPDPVNRWLLTP